MSVAAVSDIVESLATLNLSDEIAGFESSSSVTGSPRFAENKQHVVENVGPQHFSLLKLIGEGAFGKVIMVKSKLDDQYYAMKVISKKLLRKKNNVQYMKSERNILSKIQAHPFLVSLWFAFQTETKLFLVMDFLAGGELFHHLQRRGLIVESDARFYMSELVLAIESLHSWSVIHRDLKPENVLLKADGHVCITDFGLAKELADGLTTRTLCGTSEYMAPEMLSRNGYGKAVDWWSLGALFFEMLTGTTPFVSKNQKELEKKIMFEKIVTPSYLTAGATSLLKGMLEKDMNKRLGAGKGNMFTVGGVTALKQHAFFTGVDWHHLLACKVPPPFNASLQPSDATAAAAASVITPSPVKGIQHTPARPASAKSAATSPSSCSSPTTAHSSDSTMMMSMTVEEELRLLTCNFHADFTGQPVSMSVIEDCVMAAARHQPAADESNMHDTTDDSECNSVSEFADFDFASEPITCSAQRYEQFQQEVSNNLLKFMKKKALKKKQLAEKETKAQADKDRLATESRLRSEEQQRVLCGRQEEARVAALQQLLSDQTQLCSGLANKLAQAQAALTVAQEEVLKVGKRLKAVNKRLADMQQLAEKAASQGKASLTVEQRDKLSRAQQTRLEAQQLQEAVQHTEQTVSVLVATVAEAQQRLVTARIAEEESKKEIARATNQTSTAAAGATDCVSAPAAECFNATCGAAPELTASPAMAATVQSRVCVSNATAKESSSSSCVNVKAATASAVSWRRSAAPTPEKPLPVSSVTASATRPTPAAVAASSAPWRSASVTAAAGGTTGGVPASAWGRNTVTAAAVKTAPVTSTASTSLTSSAAAETSEPPAQSATVTVTAPATVESVATVPAVTAATPPATSATVAGASTTSWASMIKQQKLTKTAT